MKQQCQRAITFLHCFSFDRLSFDDVIALLTTMYCCNEPDPNIYGSIGVLKMLTELDT